MENQYVFGYTEHGYIELRSAKRVGENQSLEVDFIAVKESTPTYIQVSLSILDEMTRGREMKALETIKDSYEKIILTMDTLDLSYNGIKHINILTFLME